MPIFLLALSQMHEVNMTTSLISFFVIHLLIYPASNGYNSYVDKDDTPIGGLEKPPIPTKQLFYVTIGMECLALLISSIWINIYFTLGMLVYISGSRMYSSRLIRFKKYPILGFLSVFIFQGAFTYYISCVGITNSFYIPSLTELFVLSACSFQIGGVYPLTQIFQHESDLKDGVTTISYKLGYIGTFIFSAIMFLCCNICYFIYFNQFNQTANFYILQIIFFPIASYFVYWFLKVIKDESQANFKHTMRLNIIAAVCMNLFSIILNFIK
jgi:hypothetical protein